MTRIAAHHAAAMHKVMVLRATQHGMLQEASKQVAAQHGRPHVGAQCIPIAARYAVCKRTDGSPHRSLEAGTRASLEALETP
jgi:hypothetical protein